MAGNRQPQSDLQTGASQESPGGSPPLAAISGPAGFPFALQRLRRHVEDERVKCWAMVTLLALLSIPLGYLTMILFVLLGSFFGEFSSGSGPDLLLPSVLAVGAGVVVQILTFVGLPIMIVGGALLNYHRQYRIVRYDFVYGAMAIVAVDESFGQVIEDARRERWRPNPNQVDAGKDSVGHFNHLAHYYQQYYQVYRGSAEIRPPYTVEQNCWLEGPLLIVSVCPACMLLYPVLMLRVVLSYPAVLAVKTVVYELLSGRFDAELERQWTERITRISSGFAQ